MTTPTKKGAPISEGSRDLTVLPRTRHAELAKASGCNLNTRANQAQQWERHPQVNWKRPAAGRQRTLKRLLPPEFACALPTQRSSKTEAGNGVRPTPKLSASTPPTIAPGRFQPDRIPNKTFSSFLKASGASVPAASRGFASTTLIISSRFHWAAQMSGGTCNCFALPAISARAVSPQLSMQSVLGNCFNRQGAGRSAAKLMAVIRAHPGQNCIPSDPLDAGVSQNRSSGHAGEGPPARMAKGYGQRRWVGQLRVSRIGVPKASFDGLCTYRKGN